MPFPFTDLSSSKKRPALVVSNKEFNSSSCDVICCLITTNKKSNKYSVEINQNNIKSGNIHFESRIKPYRLFTVDKKIIIKKFAVLNKETLLEVSEKLNSCL